MDPTPFDLEHELRRHGSSLRRLARELVRDGAAADDAVQETFLHAVRRPPPAGERTGGWLATVLRRVVSRSRRGERRRVRREDAVAGEPVVADPAEVAARTELAQRLMAAVHGLDEPYRGAVWQRWFEELPPRAIAARTGVPLLTVKSRLQRGLQQLRQRLGEEGESSDWRSALACAFGFAVPKGAAAAATVTAGRGGELMATGAEVTAAVSQAAAGVEPPVTREVNATAPAAGSAATVVQPPGVPSSQQRVLADEAAPPPAASRPLATWRGRVVDAATGIGLAGATVELVVRDSAPPLDVRTTDDDGRFEVVAELGAFGRLRFAHPGYGSLASNLDNLRLEAGQVEELGDLPLPPGRPVGGRLQDAAGAPPPAGTGVTAGFAWTSAATWTQFGLSTASTQADGTFAFDALPFGRVTFGIDRGPFELADPAVVELTPTAPSDLTLTVRRRPMISGRVVDLDGNPLQGIGLATVPGEAETRTDGDGTFELVKRWRNDRTSTSVLVVDAPDHAPRGGGYELAWGTRGARIVLPPAQQLAIDVVGDDGTPIEDFGVVVWRPGLEASNGPVRHRGTHPDGRLLLPASVGATRVRVLPVDPEWVPSELLPIDDAAGLQVRLARRRTCRVEVFAAGRPVAGAEVALAFDRGRVPKQYPVRAPAQMPEFVDVRVVESALDLGGELVAAGRTDPHGIVELLCDPRTDQHVLAIDDGDQPVHFVVAPEFPADGRVLRVELPQFGVVEGHVELRGRPRFGVTVAFTNGAVEDAVRPQPDGTFRSPMLPEGPCEVALVLADEGAGTRVPGSERTVTVSRAAPARVDFDLGDHLLASVAGRVDGGAAGRALVVDFLRVDDAPRAQVVASAEVAADGTFAVAGLVPGTLRVALRRADATPFDVPGLLAETITLTAGERGWLDVPAPRRLVLRLRQEDGTPVQGARVIRRCAGMQWPSFTMFMAPVDGPVVLDPAPWWPVELCIHADGAAWSEPVTMPPDRAEAEVTVVLPDPNTSR